jgi:hypothetical protein
MSIVTDHGAIEPSIQSTAFSVRQIEEVASGTPSSIASWIRTTAMQRGVSVQHLPTDIFARAASLLSDAMADLDPIEEILVSLGRAKIITPFQCGLLQVHYLR